MRLKIVVWRPKRHGSVHLKYSLLDRVSDLNDPNLHYPDTLFGLPEEISEPRGALE